MRKTFVIAVCAVCLNVIGFAAQNQGGETDSKASFTKFVQDSIKATTSNDAKWMEGDPNLVTGYALLSLSYCRPKK